MMVIKKKKPIARKDTSSKGKMVAKKKAAKKRIPLKPRVPRTRNANTWTEAEYFAHISIALRDTFRYWKPMYNALNRVRRPYTGKPKSIGKTQVKWEYKCAFCGNYFIRTEVQIDHIVPCGSLRSYEDIVPFLQRLTAEDEKSYQILCKKDHKVKTDKENEARKVLRLAEKSITKTEI
jgi:5-methylcytosine-specific restriction endonuclease McrA